MRTMLIVCVLALLAACGSSGDQAESTGLSSQQQRIRTIFEQVAKLDENDVDSFERLYKEAIACCPDTQRVHEAYHRLYNVYIHGSEPAREQEARALCEDYLSRYPQEDAPLRLDMQNRMLNYYQDAGEYDKEAALYDQLFEKGFEAFPLSQPEAHAFAHAEALEKVGRMDEALALYRKVLEYYEPGDFMHDLASEAIARLGG